VTANLGTDPVPLPAGAEVLLSSSPEFDGGVGPDMCVWWLDADPSASV
jgi:alpha-glucosidase